ncbi:MAG TPA: phospholipid carrier-dependent glycosyltransferase [Saprospiraceae bacterium]|nr:phospholipid carrier-dependent glycosyltransferase [Saprospiraceae bacterium]
MLFFFPFLGGVHLFDRDEINFAECAREMLLTGDWVRPQIDFQPFFEKPPLFFWAQALSMQVFGVNEFAARFPNAVCGLVTLLLVYRIGFRLHDRMFAWLWVLAWLGSFLPHFYFRSGMIDPWFNLFIFCGLYGFIEFRWQFLTKQTHRTFWQKYRYLLAGGGILGLAVMTKGPTAYLIVMLVLGLYWARYRFKGRGYLKHLAVFSAATWLVAFAWFGSEIALHGADFARQFAAYQIRLFSTPDAGHGGFFGYHAVVLLLGCFPVSVFALSNLWGDRQSEDELIESDTLASCQRSDLTTWMQLLFWTSIVLFSIVQTNIVHYASLCYFPLTYLGSVTIWRAIRWEMRPKLIPFLLPAVGIVVAGSVLILPWLGQHPEHLRGLFAGDLFAIEALHADVEWALWQGLPGLMLIVAIFSGLYFWLKKRTWLAAQIIFGGGAVFAKMTMLFIACNIEGHTQRAAIEFYKSKRGEACIIQPVGFKTYAHLFYACKQPDTPVDKTYLISKINDADSLLQTPGCRELYRRNGFVFFEQQKESE